MSIFGSSVERQRGVAHAARVPLPDLAGLRTAFAATVFTLIIGYAATAKLGLSGLLVPLAIALVAILLLHPTAMAAIVVSLTILCEGPSFGLFQFTSKLYDPIVKDVSILDGLVALTVLAVALDIVRRRRHAWVPRPLRIPLTLLALAMVAGSIVGHASGVSVHLALVSEHVLAYLLLLPLAIANLNADDHRLRLLIRGALTLAVFKAGLGLVQLGTGHSVEVEGHGHLTYYEATANWVIMVALLGIFGAIVTRQRLSAWVLGGGLVLLASLLLSYRRSFWIATILGLGLVLMIGIAPSGRRLLLPAGLALIAAIWTVSTVNVQSQNPIVERAVSLAPSRLQTNRDDRYRLDERANVLAEIRSHPISGLGMSVPWAADIQPLSVEHEGGREYVHFAALWFWLKLGILGLAAYLALIVGAGIMGWRGWRDSGSALTGLFGLASVCAVAGLAVMDTTASFTGVDPRFTVVFAAQLGLLGLVIKLSHDAAAPNRY